jgi:outer membrane protein
MSLRKAFLVLSVTISIQIFSQEQWSFEKCIDYALANNLKIKQSDLDTKSDEAYLLQARGARLPSIGAGGTQQFAWGRDLNKFTNTFSSSSKTTNVNLNANMNLFNGFQLMNTVEQSKLNLHGSLQMLEKAKNDITISIASAYLQILLSRELVKIAAKQLELSSFQVVRIQKLVEAGKVAEGDLYEAKAQVSQDELQLINYQNNLTLARVTLLQILELTDLQKFDIEEPKTEIVVGLEKPDSIDVIYNDALTFLPELKGASYYVESAKKGLSISRSGYIPSLSLYSGYYTGYTDQRIRPDGSDYPFSNQFKDNASLGLGLSLRVPIFNQFQVKSRVNIAKINVSKSQITLEQTKKQIYKDIQQVYVNTLASEKRYYATQRTVESTGLAFKYAQQKYDNGIMNSYDYNIAKTKVAKAEADLQQAKFEYLFNTKILDFYRGKAIKL